MKVRVKRLSARISERAGECERKKNERKCVPEEERQRERDCGCVRDRVSEKKSSCL